MSDRSGRSLVWVAAAVLLVAVGWMAFRSGANADAGGSADSVPPQAQSAAPVAPLAPAATPAQSVVGVAPMVRADANANVASIAEASKSGRHPERLSMLIAPKPFSQAAFVANPQAYLDVVEPGRVFQSAEPGLDVPVLDVVGRGSQQIPVGGSCDLVVKTAPLAPVSYTTMDLGTFSNGLTAITVRADEEGVAKATYTASGGVIADVSVLVGSPLASGQVSFFVFVTEPTVAVSKP